MIKSICYLENIITATAEAAEAAAGNLTLHQDHGLDLQFIDHQVIDDL